MPLRVVDLEQVGQNEWRLRGSADAYLMRTEQVNAEGFPIVRWIVRVDIKGAPVGTWQGMQNALSQAFNIASGRGADAAKQSLRRD